MFSATWPQEIQAMARQFCQTAPIHITIGNQEFIGGGLTINRDIQQVVHVLDSSMEKFDRMKQLFAEACVRPDGSQCQQKIIIFCAKKIGVDQLE